MIIADAKTSHYHDIAIERFVMKHLRINAFRFISLVVFFATTLPLQLCAAPPIDIYILAGQSNMQGQGVVDLDHPKYYNGGRGTLARVMLEPRNINRFKHIRDNKGDWVVRDDVWCRYQTEKELKKGRLTIGFTGYPCLLYTSPSPRD